MTMVSGGTTRRCGQRTRRNTEFLYNRGGKSTGSRSAKKKGREIGKKIKASNKEYCVNVRGRGKERKGTGMPLEKLYGGGLVTWEGKRRWSGGRTENRGEKQGRYKM